MATKVRGPISVTVRLLDGMYMIINMDLEMIERLVSDEGYNTDVKIADASETSRTIGEMIIPPLELMEGDE